MLIAEAVEFYRKAVQPSRGPAVGASEGDVVSLEERLGSRFPLAYREFLLWMGEDRKGLLQVLSASSATLSPTSKVSSTS